MSSPITPTRARTSLARALFRKNAILLYLFLFVGVVLATFGAASVGFENAFVFPPVDDFSTQFPPFRSSISIGLIHAFLGCLFGWAAGSQDRMRGLSDYLYHRSVPTAHVFFGQLALCMVVMLGWLVLPWLLIAAFGSSPFPAEYLALGLPHIAAGSIAIPCFSVGFFLANLRLHLVLRLALTIPMLLLMIGRDLSGWLIFSLAGQPWMSTFYNILWSVLLLGGAWAAFLGGDDRDTPSRTSAMVSYVVLLCALCLPWQQAARSASDISLMEAMGNYVATDGQGAFFVATSRAVDGDGKPKLLRMNGTLGPAFNIMEHFKVDSKTHELGDKIETPSRVRLRRNDELPFPQNFFSMAVHHKRNVNVSGDEALPLYSLRTFAGYPKGQVSHFVATRQNSEYELALGEDGKPLSAFLFAIPDTNRTVWIRDAKDAYKLVLDRNGEPFSNDLFVLPDTGSTVWVGDVVDQTIWFADLSSVSPRYEQVALPEGFTFRRWASPASELEARLRASIPGEGTLAFIPSGGKHAALELDSHTVVALSDEQESWIQEAHMKMMSPRFGLGPVGRILPKPLNFFGKHEEVHDENGSVLFAHDFTAKSSREKLWVAARLGVSALTIPILQPGTFGMSRSGYMPPPFYQRTALTYDRYRLHSGSPGLLSSWMGSSLDWRSIPFWLLLAGLAWVMRRRLQRLGATGPRLWIWPLAIMCFGVLGALVCWITERRRAYLPAAAGIGESSEAPLLKSA